MSEEFATILIIIILVSPPMVLLVRWLLRTFHEHFP